MPEIETRLAYRLRQLTAEQRAELLARLGISRTTLWARLERPGTFSLDDARALHQFLEELDGESYDMLEMLRPIQLT